MEGQPKSSVCMKRFTRSQNKESIQEMKERMKREKELSEMNTLKVVDYYEKAHLSIGENRKPTGIIYDHMMTLHKCEWDSNYPENPNRYFSVMKRCSELGLINRCRFIEPTPAERPDVTIKHSAFIYDNLLKLSKNDSLTTLEEEASKYDAIYFNKNTFKAACIAAGCVKSLVRAVCMGEVQNGMAIVRPPGHHAMSNEYCGYCYFNNVGIVAKHALDHKLAEKILIVDFDVHHGQATQQMFYNDNRVLYFSIHRYENGTFWPNLRESSFEFIGQGAGAGYNINVPLNVTNLGDNDYLSIVLQILLPVAYEFDPSIVIFSAGYDACVGCPEGQMLVTPGFYGHLITLLGGLANGKQAVCLEGGYFLPSLAEGAAMTLRALLDDEPAQLQALTIPHPTVVEVINNVKFMLHPYWKCFIVYNTYTYNIKAGSNLVVHNVNIKYLSQPNKPPYETRNCYPVPSQNEIERFNGMITQLQEDYSKLKIKHNVCYSYDADMLDHRTNVNHPENPDRLRKVYEVFLLMKHNERCIQVPSHTVSPDVIKLVHSPEYVDSLLNGTYMPTHTDIYFDAKSVCSILKSTGCLISVVDNVMKGESQSGVALIRPPGHHAEHSEAQGFCFISNVAVAAKYILENYKLNRILILDFDIHHGNGTQHAFYSDEKVLYISIHKYNQGNFFPFSVDADYDQLGEGLGLGFNVNIPFNKERMGDSEYLAVFHRIVLPIVYSYNPEVIIVSAGFDAGVDDIIGNYGVTPEAFGHFIQMLKPLAQGHIILALEGGYNITTLAYSINMCIKALLGDPLPKLNLLDRIKKSALETIETVMQVQKAHWPILQVDRKLPDKIYSLTLIKDEEEVVIKQPSRDYVQKMVDAETAASLILLQ